MDDAMWQPDSPGFYVGVINNEYYTFEDIYIHGDLTNVGGPFTLNDIFGKMIEIHLIKDMTGQGAFGGNKRK